MLKLSVCFFTISAFAAPLGIQERWAAISDPLKMGINFETRLHMLPMKASVNRPGRFWSGDYWPLNKGSINQRWNARSGFNLASPTRDQLLQMNQDQIAQLSPAEKFDLLNGRYTYPLKSAIVRISNPNAQNWEGICHGWAPAAMNHVEPKPKTLRNKDGVLIPFGSSDIKALISYYYAYPYRVPSTYQVGQRCNYGRRNENENCHQDLNAGAFHLVLANKIGFENLGFVADMDRFDEVWNHPIFAYDSVIVANNQDMRSAAPGSIRTVTMRTRVSYTDENDNYWDPVIGTRRQVVKTQEFRYVLDIDGTGQVIGGLWKSASRPDFLWTMGKPKRFLPGYERLSDLLND